MNIGQGANIVVNTSSMIKRRAMRRIIEAIRERGAKLVLSDELEGQYRMHAADAGLAPRTLWIELERLRREGKLIYKRDEELTPIAPQEDEDAPIIDLAKAAGAIIITSDKELKERKAGAYGIQAFYLHEFLSDC